MQTNDPNELHTEEVPDEAAITFFQLPDADKDSIRFVELLTLRYRGTDGSWQAEWAGFHFPSGIDFSGATFVRPVDFTNATFLGSVSFKGATFGFTATFDGATFIGPPDFNGAIFKDDASFSKAIFKNAANFEDTTFAGSAAFGEARFEKTAAFGGATFASDSGFGGATFRGNASFGRVSFIGPAKFQNARFNAYANFGSSIFSDDALFPSARFLGDETKFFDAKMLGTTDFRKALFVGRTGFDDAKILQGLFHDVIINSEMKMRVSVPQGGALQFRRAVNGKQAKAGMPGSGPVIRFGSMSLERVELRNMDVGPMRLNGTSDVEKLSLYDVTWKKPGRGNRLADEDDMEEDLVKEPREGPSPQEVERLYRALRKNREDRNDRAEGHLWYFAEMEVGRKHSTNPFTKAARNFYRYTSGYGLSAGLAALSFVIVIVAASLLFTIPWSGICPVHDPVGKFGQVCVGWGTRLRLVMLAVSLQGVPDGVRLGGIPANAVWLLARVGGAAMLVSVAVAFRNQISR
jgi:hypothetical protein